ncbi:MAG: hypothetical protein M3164_00105 [Actinomycetota bacterium]|nr:hypothetical protein [Actinomycetota bacterium]
MTVILVAVLVGLWGLVLLPVLMKDRVPVSPLSSAGIFNRSLRPVGSAQPHIGGRWVLMPMSPEDEPLRRLDVEKRRKVFFSLLGSGAATLAIHLITGSRMFLLVTWILGAAFVACVAYLIYTKKKYDKFRLIGETPEQALARRQHSETILSNNVVPISSTSQVRVKYPPKPPRRPADLARDEEFWRIRSFSDDESRIPG